MNLLPWSLTLKIIAGSFHSVAIACTVFRLMYRWYMARFWWEDGWAMVALVIDVLCLISALLEVPTTDQGSPEIDIIAYWTAALGFTCVLWACRISILFSIIRIVNPSQQLRRITFIVGCSFIIMWAALTGQKIYICVTDSCIIAASVGLSQLITDVVSDTALVVLPIYFLRRTNMARRQRILIYSVFSASLLITGVTILHSIVLFTVISDGIIVIGHVKTALSLIVCNLLVIVAFICRVCHRGREDLDAPEEVISFTNVDLNTGFTETRSSADKCTTTVGATTSEWSPSESAGITVGVEEKTDGITGSRSCSLH